MERFLARLLIKAVVKARKDKVCWLKTKSRNLFVKSLYSKLEGGEIRVVPSRCCVEYLGFT